MNTGVAGGYVVCLRVKGRVLERRVDTEDSGGHSERVKHDAIDITCCGKNHTSGFEASSMTSAGRVCVTDARSDAEICVSCAAEKPVPTFVSDTNLHDESSKTATRKEP